MLNSKHSLLKRLPPDTIASLTKLSTEEDYSDALRKLFEACVTDTRVNPDDNNWLVKRARLDGQEALIESLKTLFKE